MNLFKGPSPVSSVETECHEDRVHARNVSHHRHDVLCEILTERMCCDIDSQCQVEGKSGVTMVITNWRS